MFLDTWLTTQLAKYRASTVIALSKSTSEPSTTLLRMFSGAG